MTRNLIEPISKLQRSAGPARGTRLHAAENAAFRRAPLSPADGRMVLKWVLIVIICLLLVPATLNAEVLGGRVRWEGNLRRLPQVAKISHKGACDEGAYRQVERKGRRLAGVAVWLVPVAAEGQGSGINGQETTITLNENRCEFVPRIALVSPGSSVAIWNRDPQRHWLLAEGKSFRRRQFFHRGGDTVSRFVIRRGDKVHLRSGLHRWMDAWVVAVDTSWAALADKKGGFEFKDVPPGEYVLHAWHPQLGEETSIVTVPVKKPVVIGYRTTADTSDPDLKLSIPRMRKEWVRTRGDRAYK